jgi:hypothetical protein
MRILLDAHISGRTVGKSLVEAFRVLISGVEETIADTWQEEWVARVTWLQKA